MIRHTHFRRLIALSLIGSFALSACGIRGSLETPPPLWGEDTRTQAEIESNAKTKADRAEREARKTQ